MGSETTELLDPYDAVDEQIHKSDAIIPREAYLEERIVDHEFPSYTVFECSICYAKNEQYHNFCCICGAKFKEIKYVRMD